MPPQQSTLAWAPQLLLLLAPLLAGALLLFLGHAPAVVGGAAFCLLADALLPRVASGGGGGFPAPPPVCALAPVTLGLRPDVPARAALLAFAAGYLGTALRAPGEALLFTLLVALLVLDSALARMLGCTAGGTARLLFVVAGAGACGAATRQLELAYRERERRRCSKQGN